MSADDFRVGVFHGDDDIGSAFPDGDRLRKAGGGYVLADMLCQYRVRACADRTGATGDRVRRRLLERAIDAGARDFSPRVTRATP
jgi:hypothetical protein